jgi:REP element-mobilizing transposase RayT
MNRGARRASVFGEPAAARLFLTVLSELPGTYDVRVLAYAVMPNHYHLVLQSRSGRLSPAMKHLAGEFTQRLNRTHQWDGPLFRGRFKNRVVEDDAYLAQLYAYVHLNPVRAGLAKTAEAARWTSHRALVGATPAPPWLAVDTFLDTFGSIDAYQTCVAARAAAHDDPDWDPKHLWTQAPLATSERAAPTPPTDAVLRQLAAATRTKVDDLRASVRGCLGNHPRTVAAWWLRERTTLTNAEIAETLAMTPERVSQATSAVRRAHRGPLAALRSQAIRSSAAPIGG